MRTVLAASRIALATLALAAPGCSWTTDAKAAPASAPAGKIILSFKIDSRVLGPTYGGEHWVSPPIYTGARAQDAVEAMARAVDAKGAPVRTDPEWTVTDPELLAISPPRGKRVTITAKRPGTSKVTVKAGGASRTFTLKAEKPDGNWQLTVSQ